MKRIFRNTLYFIVFVTFIAGIVYLLTDTPDDFQFNHKNHDGSLTWSK